MIWKNHDPNKKEGYFFETSLNYTPSHISQVCSVKIPRGNVSSSPNNTHVGSIQQKRVQTAETSRTEMLH